MIASPTPWTRWCLCALWLPCGALACEEDAKPKASKRPTAEEPERATSASARVSSAASAASSAKPRLDVTVDGAPLKIDHALVKRRPDRKLQLYLGVGGGSCEALMDNLFSGSHPHVLVDLPTRLGSDGAESLVVGDVHKSGPNAPDEGASAKMHGSFGAKGSDVEIALAVASKEAKVELRGTVIAKSCGDELRDKGPGVIDPPLKSSASMTIAGHKIPIRGALARRDGVELTDFPRDCSAAWFLGARLAQASGSWTLDGERVGAAKTGPASGLRVKRGPELAEKRQEGAIVELELAGDDRLDGYAVKLEGKVEALVCP